MQVTGEVRGRGTRRGRGHRPPLAVDGAACAARPRAAVVRQHGAALLAVHEEVVVSGEAVVWSVERLRGSGCHL